MKSIDTRIIRIFLGSLLLLCFLVGAESSLCCGKVYDGPSYLVDIDELKSHHRIFASWTGFSGNCAIGTSTSTGIVTTRRPLGGTPSHTPYAVSGRAHGSTGAFGNDRTQTSPGVTYRVAVISQALADTAILSSGFNATGFSPRCRISSGLGNVGSTRVKVTPDIVDWTYVGTNLTYINLNVSLHNGIRYYIIIRAHVQGRINRTVYSNSNGWTVSPTGGADDDDGSDDENGDDDDEGDNDDVGNNFDDGNSTDDKDDGLHPYQSGLIAMGCALGCLLLLCLLLLLVFATRKGEDKYTTTVHRNENVDKL